MPLVRLGPHESNPFFRASRGMAGATPDLPSGHAVLFKAAMLHAPQPDLSFVMQVQFHRPHSATH
jgi:hypothetical protein